MGCRRASPSGTFIICEMVIYQLLYDMNVGPMCHTLESMLHKHKHEEGELRGRKKKKKGCVVLED